MKKLFLLLAIAFLFQSCFNYKRMELVPSKMVTGQKYKIERNHKFFKVTFNRITDSSIIVTKNWKEEQIPLKEITAVKKRKFSIVKTVAVTVAVSAALTGLFILSYDGPSIGTISWNK